MCLLIDRNYLGVERLPLIDSQIKLKKTVHLPDRILPCGSIYTVKMSKVGFAYIEDAKGSPIFNYFNVANFLKLN